jgi:multiple sugar transport system permease protein
MRTRRSRAVRRLFGLYLPLAVFMVFALFPFYWMLISSFKANPELYNLRANRLWIQQSTLEQFHELFAKTEVLRWLANSFFVSFLTALISMTFGIMAGYALARLKFRGAQALGVATFVTYLVPTELSRGDAYFWGELMAASLLGSVPVALLYSFFMEYFVTGLTAGALKG